MEVHVRLGPGLSHQIGSSRVTVPLAFGSTVRDLFEYMRATYPLFSATTGTILAVIDGTTVGDRHVLISDTDVALLLPISGG